MRIIKKNVYYCEFCNKKGLAVLHIKNHEEGCTANPDRKCGLCDGRDIKQYVEEIKSRFEIKDCIPDEFMGHTLEVVWKGEPIKIEDILDFTEGCPNCTLAILRQTKLNYEIFGFKYDYKAELNSWWAEINKKEWERERREMAGGCYY